MPSIPYLQKHDLIILMTLIPLLHGIIIGFALAVPVGPIGILCIKRSLVGGTRSGLVVGLGGATADIVYALAAAFGVSLIIDFVDSQQLWMRLIGGCILLGAGFHLTRSRPSALTPAKWESTNTRAYISTLFLALTNPLTLLAFAAAFSTIGAQTMTGQVIPLVLLISGVFLGSLTWFSLLAGLARLFRQRLTARGIDIINKIAGALLMLFGVVGLYLALRAL